MDIRANDPSRKSWLEIPEDSDFSMQNLPFGIFSTKGGEERAGVAIGNHILDLAVLAENGLVGNLSAAECRTATLNKMMARGKKGMREIRNIISDLLEESNTSLKDDQSLRDSALVAMDDALMHMPVTIGDYTDFYSSRDHATNVGKMFRDPENALLPNWLHIPVGYHGRASSVIVSDTPIHRPKGQMRPDPEAPPVYGPCRLLDFELEMGFVTFDGKPLGQSISTAEADDYIFGMVIFNDWSARDIQKWEYVPLGPFLGKSFASSISPWIVTLDALEPFRCQGEEQNPPVLPYLEFAGQKNINIDLEVGILPKGGEEKIVSRSNYKYMYWNMCQQLAHHAVNGCNIRCGDMMASGTISGPTEDSYGSMLEISWRGTKPVQMPDGTERKFINDHDTVIMRGHAIRDGVRVGFGEVRTEVLPTLD